MTKMEGMEPASRSEWRRQLKEEIQAAENRFDRGKDRWNRWYYFFLVLGITLPAFSALVLKLDFSPEMPNSFSKNDVSAMLAVMGAIATSIMAAFNVRRRWAISRTARSDLYELRIEVLKPDVDLDEIASRLKAAISKYNQAVLKE